MIHPSPQKREEQGRKEGEGEKGGEKGKRSSYLSSGGQIFDAVGFEEGEVDHGLEQGDGLLRVPGLAQEVALLKKER